MFGKIMISKPPIKRNASLSQKIIWGNSCLESKQNKTSTPQHILLAEFRVTETLTGSGFGIT
jgi:hypothetical protein